MAVTPIQDAHWRDSAREPKFFILDAKASFPFILFLMHIQWWTLIVAVSGTIFFTLLNRFGFSIPVFRRWVRSQLAGKRRTAHPWWV